MDPETIFIDNQYLKAISLRPRPIGGGLGECPPYVARRLAEQRKVRISGNTVQVWGAI